MLLLPLMVACMILKGQTTLDTYSVYDVNHDTRVSVQDVTEVVEQVKADLNDKSQVVDAAALHSVLLSIDSSLRALSKRLDEIETRLGLTIGLTPQTFTVGDVTFTMMPVVAGSFEMGSEDGFDSETPVHSVTISQNYYLGKTEVTQALWSAVMETTSPSWTGTAVGNNYPAYGISYDEALMFIKRLNLLTGADFRLPTEAEWEYAARGGNANADYTYSGSDQINVVAWYQENTEHAPRPVRYKGSNDLGLYDMTGNVQEWCSDWFSANYYAVSPEVDPTGPEKGNNHVLRGGHYNSQPRQCRLTFRASALPSSTSLFNGFRLALSANH